MSDLIIGIAWEDERIPGYPERVGDPVRQLARDRVIEAGIAAGKPWRWGHDMHGERWDLASEAVIRDRTDEHGRLWWPVMWISGMIPSGVHGWRSIGEFHD